MWATLKIELQTMKAKSQIVQRSVMPDTANNAMVTKRGEKS